MSATELHYVDLAANHDKFWRVSVDSDVVTTTYGRNGTAGTSGSKSYPSPEAAQAAADKAIASKIAKGYVRV